MTEKYFRKIQHNLTWCKKWTFENKQAQAKKQTNNRGGWWASAEGSLCYSGLWAPPAHTLVAAGKATLRESSESQDLGTGRDRVLSLKAYVPGQTVVAFTQAGESTSLKSPPRLGRSSSRDSDLGFEIFISLVGPESVLCTYFHRLHEGLLKEIQRALGFPQNLLN